MVTRRVQWVGVVLITVIVLVNSSETNAQFTVINVIPGPSSAATSRDFSDESSQNGEPSIAVNPSEIRQMTIGTFGRTLPMRANEPYFTSSNFGRRWDNFAIHDYPHGDTTAEWSPSGTAYAAFLNAGQMDVRSSPNPTLNNAANQFMNIAGSTYPPAIPPAMRVDQPWLEVSNVGGRDRFYVGLNDPNQPAGRNASIRLFTDAGVIPPAMPMWQTISIDTVGGAAGDGVPVRVAANGNTVYAVFQRWSAGMVGTDAQGDIVVVRDINGGANTFMDRGRNNMPLTPVAQNIAIPFDVTTLGQERLGSDLSIAVKNSNELFVAYADVHTPPAGVAQPRLRVAHSTDGGEIWRDVFTRNNASLPALAVANNGNVGLLYTALNNNNLETHFAQSFNNFTTSRDVVLTNQWC